MSNAISSPVSTPEAANPDTDSVPAWTPTEGKALVLRTVDTDRRSYNNFLWPESGPVECPDWEPTRKCGHGLHGALWGQGNGGLFSWGEALWQVVEVVGADVIELGGKVKFPRGVVVYSGDRQAAVDLITKHAPAGTTIIAGTATAGDGGTATAGYRGTATAGYRGAATAGYRGAATAGYSGTATAGDSGTATAGDGGTATAGYRGTATAGYRGTATAGDSGTATAGYRGAATAGDGGTATAGDGGAATAGYRGAATAGDGGAATAGYRGTATAGDGGTATAGDGGTATAGYRGTATAGDGGTATAGNRGAATAGDGGTVIITFWDDVRRRYRKAIAEVGIDGIEPNVAYRVEAGELVRADGETA